MKLNFWIAFKLLFSRRVLFGGSAPLSFLGLVLGVAALVVSMAVMSGYVETMKVAMTDTTGDIQISKRGRLTEDWQDFSANLKKIDSRIEAMMRFGYAEAVMARNGRVSGVLLQGVDLAELKTVLNIENRLKQGVLDISNESIAIGVTLSKKHDIKVGDKIYLVVPLATPFGESGFKRQSKEFKVSSVIDFGKNEWNERLVLGSLTALQQLTQIGDRYTGVFVKLSNREYAPEVALKLNDKLGLGFSIMTWYDVNRNLFEAVVIERAVIFFVVFLIVVVAAFNISGTLYVFIRQKYSDIAILKTLGLTPQKIRAVFMSQGVIVAALGTVLGTILGYLLCAAFMFLQEHYSLISGSVYKIDKIYTQIRFIDLFVIALSTQLICILAAYFPAVKGGKLDVVEGLKNG